MLINEVMTRAFVEVSGAGWMIGGVVWYGVV